jgi:hypothetical protein
MTKFFKGQKKAANVEAKPAEPRKMDEIKTEYAEVKSRLGDAQYLKFVYDRETELLSQRMLEINQEASKRQKLDTEEKAKETPEATDAKS